MLVLGINKVIRTILKVNCNQSFGIPNTGITYSLPQCQMTNLFTCFKAIESKEVFSIEKESNSCTEKKLARDSRNRNVAREFHDQITSET